MQHRYQSRTPVNLINMAHHNRGRRPETWAISDTAFEELKQNGWHQGGREREGSRGRGGAGGEGEGREGEVKEVEGAEGKVGVVRRLSSQRRMSYTEPNNRLRRPGKKSKSSIFKLFRSKKQNKLKQQTNQSQSEIDLTIVARGGPGRLKLVGDGTMFGRELESIVINGNLPAPVLYMMRYLYTEGRQTSGIFRMSASKRACLELRMLLDRRCPLTSDLDLEDIIYSNPVLTVANVFQDFVRNLPDCLLASGLYSGWLKSYELSGDTWTSHVRDLVSRLPSSHVLLLRHLACLLVLISANAELNLMTAKNLAVCWSQTLLRPRCSSSYASPTSASVPHGGGDCEGSDLEIQMRDKELVVAVVQRFIDGAAKVFGEECLREVSESLSLERHRPELRAAASCESIDSQQSCETRGDITDWRQGRSFDSNNMSDISPKSDVDQFSLTYPPPSNSLPHTLPHFTLHRPITDHESPTSPVAPPRLKKKLRSSGAIVSPLPARGQLEPSRSEPPKTLLAVPSSTGGGLRGVTSQTSIDAYYATSDTCGSDCEENDSDAELIRQRRRYSSVDDMLSRGKVSRYIDPKTGRTALVDIDVEQVETSTLRTSALSDSRPAIRKNTDDNSEDLSMLNEVRDLRMIPEPLALPDENVTELAAIDVEVLTPPLPFQTPVQKGDRRPSDVRQSHQFVGEPGSVGKLYDSAVSSMDSIDEQRLFLAGDGANERGAVTAGRGLKALGWCLGEAYTTSYESQGENDSTSSWTAASSPYSRNRTTTISSTSSGVFTRASGEYAEVFAGASGAGSDSVIEERRKNRLLDSAVDTTADYQFANQTVSDEDTTTATRRASMFATSGETTQATSRRRHSKVLSTSLIRSDAIDQTDIVDVATSVDDVTPTSSIDNTVVSSADVTRNPASLHSGMTRSGADLFPLMRGGDVMRLKTETGLSGFKRHSIATVSGLDSYLSRGRGTGDDVNEIKVDGSLAVGKSTDSRGVAKARDIYSGDIVMASKMNLKLEYAIGEETAVVINKAKSLDTSWPPSVDSSQDDSEIMASEPSPLQRNSAARTPAARGRQSPRITKGHHDSTTSIQDSDSCSSTASRSGSPVSEVNRGRRLSLMNLTPRRDGEEDVHLRGSAVRGTALAKIETRPVTSFLPDVHVTAATSSSDNDSPSTGMTPTHKVSHATKHRPSEECDVDPKVTKAAVDRQSKKVADKLQTESGTSKTVLDKAENKSADIEQTSKQNLPNITSHKNNTTTHALQSPLAEIYKSTLFNAASKSTAVASSRYISPDWLPPSARSRGIRIPAHRRALHESSSDESSCSDQVVRRPTDRDLHGPDHADLRNSGVHPNSAEVVAPPPPSGRRRIRKRYSDSRGSNARSTSRLTEGERSASIVRSKSDLTSVIHRRSRRRKLVLVNDDDDNEKTTTYKLILDVGSQDTASSGDVMTSRDIASGGVTSERDRGAMRDTVVTNNFKHCDDGKVSTGGESDIEDDDDDDDDDLRALNDHLLGNSQKREDVQNGEGYGTEEGRRSGAVNFLTAGVSRTQAANVPLSPAAYISPVETLATDPDDAEKSEIHRVSPMTVLTVRNRDWHRELVDEYSQNTIASNQHSDSKQSSAAVQLRLNPSRRTDDSLSRRNSAAAALMTGSVQRNSNTAQSHQNTAPAFDNKPTLVESGKSGLAERKVMSNSAAATINEDEPATREFTVKNNPFKDMLSVTSERSSVQPRLPRYSSSDLNQSAVVIRSGQNCDTISQGLIELRRSSCAAVPINTASCTRNDKFESSEKSLTDLSRLESDANRLRVGCRSDALSSAKSSTLQSERRRWDRDISSLSGAAHVTNLRRHSMLVSSKCHSDVTTSRTDADVAAIVGRRSELSPNSSSTAAAFKTPLSTTTNTTIVTTTPATVTTTSATKTATTTTATTTTTLTMPVIITNTANLATIATLPTTSMKPIRADVNGNVRKEILSIEHQSSPEKNNNCPVGVPDTCLRVRPEVELRSRDGSLLEHRRWSMNVHDAYAASMASSRVDPDTAATTSSRVNLADTGRFRSLQDPAVVGRSASGRSHPVGSTEIVRKGSFSLPLPQKTSPSASSPLLLSDSRSVKLEKTVAAGTLAARLNAEGSHVAVKEEADVETEKTKDLAFRNNNYLAALPDSHSPTCHVTPRSHMTFSTENDFLVDKGWSVAKIKTNFDRF